MVRIPWPSMYPVSVSAMTNEGMKIDQWAQQIKSRDLDVVRVLGVPGNRTRVSL